MKLCITVMALILFVTSKVVDANNIENSSNKTKAIPSSPKEPKQEVLPPSLILLPDSQVILGEHLYKVQTYLKLAELGCPVLPSALLMDKRALEETSLQVLREHVGGSYCSLRYQYKIPSPKPLRGGNKALIQKDELEKHWKEELILWPVEHVDRVKNRYGINILYRPSNQKIVYEIVGQGFDGTDINKGDISPHQVIQINLPEGRGAYGNIWYQANNSIVSNEDYEKSTQLRREKLLKLGLTSGEILIPEKFTPLPLSQLERLDHYAQKVFSHFNYEQEINISATILEDGRIVFWDFQTPDNKSKAFFGENKSG